LSLEGKVDELEHLNNSKEKSKKVETKHKRYLGHQQRPNL
jgi:hypothetical protein